MLKFFTAAILIFGFVNPVAHSEEMIKGQAYSDLPPPDNKPEKQFDMDAAKFKMKKIYTEVRHSTLVALSSIRPACGCDVKDVSHWGNALDINFDREDSGKYDDDGAKYIGGCPQKFAKHAVEFCKRGKAEAAHFCSKIKKYRITQYYSSTTQPVSQVQKEKTYKLLYSGGRGGMTGFTPDGTFFDHVGGISCYSANRDDKVDPNENMFNNL